MTAVKSKRLAKGWRQLDLAIHAQMTPGEISNIETGRLKPTAAQAFKLARVLGLNPAALFEEIL